MTRLWHQLFGHADDRVEFRPHTNRAFCYGCDAPVVCRCEPRAEVQTQTAFGWLPAHTYDCPTGRFQR